MRKRPVSLFICAALFVYLPAEYLARMAMGAVFVPFEFVLEFALPIILALGLIRVTKAGWYTLVAMVSLWGVDDLYQYYATQGSNLGPLLIHLLIYVVSLGYFINPRVRTLYFDPKMRWWRAKPRYVTHLPSITHCDASWRYPILRNISEGGCFIETSELVDVNSVLKVNIPLPEPLNISVVKAVGEVRWVSRAPDCHGMGVQFLNMSPEVNYALREYVYSQM